MKKINFNGIMLCAMLMVSLSLFAQKPSHPKYIKKMGESETFYGNYQNWTPGTPYSSEAADDEEFFISRVKPKERFTNAQTQVDETMSPERKMLWWCPLGNNEWNAVPTYHFDSEVFNMWSYVDNYGNWTASFIRAPGAFLDACHKNGVDGSVVATVPWAASLSPTDGGHGQNFQSMIDGGSDKLLQFLRYYGIDGIGLNSEFNFTSMAPAFRTLLKNASTSREAKGWPSFGVAWYNLMNNAGSVSTAQSNSLHSGCQDWFHHGGEEVTRDFFLNYHWTGSSLQTSQTTAEALGRSSYDVYAGINMQGSSRENWLDFKNYKISIGTWGAHDMNMMFESRNELGSSPEQQQKTYLLRSERFFTGGSRNPVNTPEISNLFAYGAESAKNFHGISKFITARSALQGDLSIAPFVTYFNLGNGKYFNFQGETTYSKEWYNIGMQDYLPTWRWWFGNNFLERDAANVAANGLKASFTWDDAWFGGSCMEITGETTKEYLHLFKTKYAVEDGDQLTIRYKLVSGNADVKWACSVEGAESTAISSRTKILSAQDAPSDVWVEKVVTVGSGIRDINLGGNVLALMGLEFANATPGFKMLIGEIALTRVAAETPASPVLSTPKCKVLGLNYQGYDFKMVYSMDHTPSDPSIPVYNEDVKTWYYKVYAQQENEAPVLCTATTSWAAYVVRAPFNNEGSSRVKFGVSAVSLDGKTESAIVWTEWMDLPQPTVIDDVVVDKPVIKTNEDFTVKYKDFNHPVADQWQIVSQETGDVKFTGNNSISITTSLDAVGIYDVVVNYNNESKKYRGLIQISGDAVGALPQINTFTANNSEQPVTVKVQDEVTLAYTGRSADGVVSRGLRAPEEAFLIPVSQLGLTDKVTSFSLAFWFKSEPFTHGAGGTQMLNIRNANDNWPANNWGFVWNNINPDGTFNFNIRKQYANGGHIADPVGDTYVFEANVWTHLAYVFAWESGKLSVNCYVNGKLFAEVPATSDIYSLSTANNIMIGGVAHNRSGFNGVLDEVQLYNKALTVAEVKTCMEHIEDSSIPVSLIGYWDFESEVNEQGSLNSTGTNKNITGAIMTQQAVAGGNEGETEWVPSTIAFAPGAPFIPGTNYRIETSAQWSLGDATVVTPGDGNAEAGSATIKYNEAGDKTATVTLVNGWGSDSKTFNYVRVEDNSTDIDELDDATFSAYPNPFENEVNIQFAKEGEYELQVYSTVGSLVYSETVNVSNNQFVSVTVNAPKGSYFVQILKDGKSVKVIKLIKK